MLIAAHRGASDTLPENTIVALAAAVELGADYAEFDVRATKDGKLVLFHDERLERTTDGAGRLAEKRLHDLRPLDAGGWLGPEHAGRKIPTLNETLAVLKGTLPFIVDFKESDPAMREELVLSLRADEVLDKALVTSPHAAVLEELARGFPDVGLAVPLRIAFAGSEPVAVGRLRPRLLLARADDVNIEAVAAAHAQGLKLLATIPRDLDPPSTKARAEALAALGADGVMTARARLFLGKGLNVI